jgi:VIT1/CCC1 family predicted Fe2+/Mn2+ transporter
MNNQPQPHQEKHSGHGEIIRDSILGFADGLTVPFAVTAGLSSVGSLNLVILGGLAELFAGAISMGLGAFLAAITERKHYAVEEARELREVFECPKAEEQEIYDIMGEYGLDRERVRPVVEGLMSNKDMWVKVRGCFFTPSPRGHRKSKLVRVWQFMMDFELKLEKPRNSRAWISALVMGLSYFLGGLIPMIPYFAFHNINHALFTSIAITALILVVFGFVKAVITGCTRKDAIISSLQTLMIGIIAAGTSYGIVRGVNQIHPVRL